MGSESMAESMGSELLISRINGVRAEWHLLKLFRMTIKAYFLACEMAGLGQ